MVPAAEEERTVSVPPPPFFQPAPPGPQGTTANQGGTPASGTAANQQGTPANQAGTPNVTPLAPATGGEPLTSQPLATAAEPIIAGDSFDEADSDEMVNARPRDTNSSEPRTQNIINILSQHYGANINSIFHKHALIKYSIRYAPQNTDETIAQNIFSTYAFMQATFDHLKRRFDYAEKEILKFYNRNYDQLPTSETEESVHLAAFRAILGPSKALSANVNAIPLTHDQFQSFVFLFLFYVQDVLLLSVRVLFLALALSVSHRILPFSSLYILVERSRLIPFFSSDSLY